MDDETTKIFPCLGDEQPFYDLVDAFYQGVETDPLLRPLYREDLAPAKLHMAWFLIQRFGGPVHYGENRGHPRLRMRHVPFRIGPAESEAWLHHMNAAIAATPAFAPFEKIMQDYFASSAAFLINHSEVPSVTAS